MSDTKVLAEMIVAKEDEITGIVKLLKERDEDVRYQHNLRVEESREHEDTIHKLRVETAGLKKQLSIIDEICGGVENRAFVKVKILRDDYDNLKSENKKGLYVIVLERKLAKEKAKASKRNAEKLKLMDIVHNQATNSQDILDEYKAWLAERGKK